MDYAAFVDRKLTRSPATGMATVPALLPALKPHQRDLVAWALRRGRAAIFADTGLGKMLMELVWSAEVARHTGGDVLILAPLAVAQQIEAEGARFGIPVTRCNLT
jgi:ERCC4-related helicase